MFNIPLKMVNFGSEKRSLIAFAPVGLPQKHYRLGKTIFFFGQPTSLQIFNDIISGWPGPVTAGGWPDRSMCPRTKWTHTTMQARTHQAPKAKGTKEDFHVSTGGSSKKHQWGHQQRRHPHSSKISYFYPSNRRCEAAFTRSGEGAPSNIIFKEWGFPHTLE